MKDETARRAQEALDRALAAQGSDRALLLDQALRLHREALGELPYEPLDFSELDRPES